MKSRRDLFLLAMALLFVSASAFAGSAKGTFTANGKTVKLNYAYATTKPNPLDKKKADVFVVVTDKDIPAEAVFDEFALMDLPDKGTTGFTVEINSDKSVNSGTLFSPAFVKMHSFSSVGKQEVKLTTWTKDRIAGTVSMPADDF